MTEPGGGGDRLEVSVVADATGFARDAQAKIDAAVAGVKAKIKADIDLRRLQAQAEAAAKLVSKQTTISLKLGVDAKYLQESVRAALAGVDAQQHTVKVGVQVDTGNARREVESVGAGAKADVNVGADTSAARAEVDAFEREVESKPIDVPVRIDPQSEKSLANGGRGIRNLTGSMSGLQKAGFYAGLVQTLASAADAAGGGLFAMAGSASQASGALLALPNVAGVAAQGLGSLMAAFSGITNVMSLMGKQQAGAGKTAGTSAKAQEAAAKRVADAQKAITRAQTEQARTARDSARAVADARRAVSDSIVTGNDKISSAEDKVASAQQASTKAQNALTDARKAAKKSLQDYQLQLSGAALDEEAASLAVEEARKRWNESMANPASTDLDRREADLGLRQAEQSLKEAQASNKDLKKTADDAAKAGVEGSAKVVAAKEEVANTSKDESDAEKELAKARADADRATADARQGLADALTAQSENNADATARVTDAQSNLADALRSSAEAAATTNTAADKLAAAMAKLSPEGRAFAKFLNDTMKPRLEAFRNAIQAQVLPGVQDMLEALNRDPGDKLGSYFDVLQSGMKDSGKIMGDTAEAAGRMMSAPGFRKDTKTIMDSNNRALKNFAGAGLALVNVLKNVAVAAGPMVERFALFIKTKADLLSAFTDTAGGANKLQNFMQRAGDKAAQLGHIIGNVIKTIVNMGKAGSGAGDSLLTKLDHLTQKWETFTETRQGQKKMKDFFDKMVPLAEKLGKTIGTVVDIFVTMGQNGGGSFGGMLDAINAILKAIDWLLKSPLGPIISTLLAFSGVAAVFLLVYKQLSKMVKKLKEVGELGGKAVKSVKSAAGRVSDASSKSRGSTTADRATKTAAARDKRNAKPGRGATTADREAAANEPTPRESAKKRLNRVRAETRAGRVTATIGGGGLGELVTSDGTPAPSRSQRRAAKRTTRAAEDQRAADINDRYPVPGSARQQRRAAKRTTRAAEDQRAADINDRYPVPATVRAGARGRLAAVRSRLADDRGSMRLDMGVGGRRTATPGAAPVAQRAGGAAKRAGGAVGRVGKRAGGAAVGVGGLAAGMMGGGGGQPKTVTASNGAVVGGLGGQVAGFAASVQKASDQASKYLGGWAGDAAKTVSGWAGTASTSVADWASGGVGKAASTAGGYIKGWASDNSEQIGQWAKDAGGKMSGWASTAGTAAGKAAGGLKNLAGALKGSAAATKAMAVVQGALNLVMDANPVMLIVIAIAALVAGLIWAYFHFDSFRAIVDKVFSALKTGAVTVFDWLKKNWPLLLAIITGPIGLAVLLIVKHWDTIKAKVSAAATWVKDKVGAVFGALRDKAGQIFGALKDKVTGAFGTLRDWLGTAAEHLRDKIKAAFEKVRDKVTDAFTAIKNKVGAIWDQIKTVLRKPLQAVIDVVYNKGIRSVYNKLNDLWGGKDWGEITMPAFAAGGVLDGKKLSAAPGYRPGKDTLLAAVSPGEGFLVPEATRALGGAKGIQAINSHFSSRVPGPGLQFAAGGMAPLAAGRQASWLADDGAAQVQRVSWLSALRTENNSRTLLATENSNKHKATTTSITARSDALSARLAAAHNKRLGALGKQYKAAVANAKKDPAALARAKVANKNATRLENAHFSQQWQNIRSTGKRMTAVEARRYNNTLADLNVQQKAATGRTLRGVPGGVSRNELPTYARGGVAGDIGGPVDWVKDKGSDLSDLVSKGWQFAARSLIKPVRTMIDAVPGSGPFADNIRAGANGWLDKLVASVRGKEKETGAGSGKLGSGWQSIWSIVKAAIPQARINSTYRPGDPGYHGRGKAIDFGFGTGPGGNGSAGLASIATYLYRNFGKSLAELIYDGVGDSTPDVKNGRDHAYNAATSAEHHNHVHAAVYDSGGRFPTGTSGINTSGRDEGVLTGKGIAALGGWARLDALNAGRPLAELVATSGGAIDRTVPGQSVGTLIQEGAIKQYINNPVPETGSETLNKTLRRVADFGIFG